MTEPNPFAGLPQRLQGFAGLQAEIDAAGMGDPLKRENAELRVEIERLTHLHNLDHSLADQREAENERLKRLYDDVYAENQRLNQALDMLAEEREAWESDNERLRAALTEIMAMSEPAGYSERSKAEIRDVARRALARPKE